MARICSVRQIQKCYQAFYQTKITVCRYSYKLYLDEYSVQYRITVIYCDYIQCIWRHSNVKMCRHREGILPAWVRGSRYRRNPRPKRGSAFLLFASVVSVVRRSSWCCAFTATSVWLCMLVTPLPNGKYVTAVFHWYLPLSIVDVFAMWEQCLQPQAIFYSTPLRW